MTMQNTDLLVLSIPTVRIAVSPEEGRRILLVAARGQTVLRWERRRKAIHFDP